MSRVINFNPGPAAIPLPVLERVRDELLDYDGNGMAVMEMSHRSPAFIAIAEQAERDLRELLNISDDFACLFLQGGATTQFAAVPLNLCGDDAAAAYVDTGAWSSKAIKEARRFIDVEIAASSEPTGYDHAPVLRDWRYPDRARYIHITLNETIGGVEYLDVPEVSAGGPPLVADASSTLLSRPLDMNRFGLIYAGAQKNIGPSGLTIVIVRRDLLRSEHRLLPSTMSYAGQDRAGSMSNTPPTFAWYVAGLVFQWIKEQGGLAAMAEKNQRNASKLYHAIDDSGGFYANPVNAGSRSWMNVPFVLDDPSLDPKFLEQSAAAGLVGLKGHRSVGGMRASIYNPMPESGVDTLVAFMNEFMRTH